MCGLGRQRDHALYWNNKYVFAAEQTGVWSMLRKLGKTYLSYGATFLLSTLLLSFGS